MRGKLIVITGIMALGLSACGAQATRPMNNAIAHIELNQRASLLRFLIYPLLSSSPITKYTHIRQGIRRRRYVMGVCTSQN